MKNCYAKSAFWWKGAAVAALLTSICGSAAAQPASSSNSRGQAPGTVWGCDAPQGHSCSFVIVSQTGGLRNFNIPAGLRYSLTQAQPGVDVYFVSIDQPAPANQADCRAIQLRGGFCKAAIVNTKYNN